MVCPPPVDLPSLLPPLAAPLAPLAAQAAGPGTLSAAETDPSHVTLLIYVVVALGVSFLCSVWEAVLLAVPLSHLQVMADRGRTAARHMLRMRRHIDRPIAAILTLNTIAHTVGAAGAGAEATLIFGSRWFGLISAVLTLLILIFSEIIPKTLGATFSRQLAGFTGWSLFVLVRVLRPIVATLDLITRLMRPRERPPAVSRSELRALARIGVEEGSLEEDERLVVENLLRLGRVTVSEVMTPRTIVMSLPAAMTIGEVRAIHGKLDFSRIPVYGRTPDDVRGYVLRTDILEREALDRDDTTLGELMRPLHSVPESMTVAAALDRFLEEKAHALLVVDEYGGTAGLIALEDALETLLGREIVDESDPAVDMRVVAHRRFEEHQRRLAAMAAARIREEEEERAQERARRDGGGSGG